MTVAMYAIQQCDTWRACVKPNDRYSAGRQPAASTLVHQLYRGLSLSHACRGCSLPPTTMLSVLFRARRAVRSCWMTGVSDELHGFGMRVKNTGINGNILSFRLKHASCARIARCDGKPPWTSASQGAGDGDVGEMARMVISNQGTNSGFRLKETRRIAIDTADRRSPRRTAAMPMRIGLRSFQDFRTDLSVCRAQGMSHVASCNPMESGLQAAGTRGGIILGIETSCDETGAGVVTTEGEILGEALASQAKLHAQWGGVVPKLAEGAHEEAIDTVVEQALAMAGIQPSDLSAVAVTIGPGLSLCLKVGICKAMALAKEYRLPIIPVHHMEAHALVARLSEKDVRFPFLTLLISGGHNLLLLAHGVGRYTQLGTCLDDALGEAYDKTARLLGLELSRGGGPALEELATEGDSTRFKFSVPMRKSKNCNFSYAGMKTAVRLAIESTCPGAESLPIAAASPADRQTRADIAASFQRVAVLHLEERTRRAIQWSRDINPAIDSLVVAGGVAANQVVRERLKALVEDESSRGGAGMMSIAFPPPRLCTDNGVMVAWAGVERYRLGLTEPPPAVDSNPDDHVDIRARWPLGEVLAEGTQNVKSLKQVRNHTSLTALSEAAALSGKHSSLLVTEPCKL